MLQTYVAACFDAHERWALVKGRDLGRSRRLNNAFIFDFSKGAELIGFSPVGLFTLGTPRNFVLRVRGDLAGHALRLRLQTHFMYFERVLVPLQGLEHEWTVPAPPGEGWRHFGGENDGQLHGPLMIAGLFVEGSGRRDKLSITPLEIRVEAEASNARQCLLTAGVQKGCFIGELRSMNGSPVQAVVTATVRDWEERVVLTTRRALNLSSERVSRVRVPVPAAKETVLECEFVADIMGQLPLKTSACLVHPFNIKRSAGCDPASPFGMGVYLYRLHGNPDKKALERTAALAASAGVKWSREEFHWSLVEPRKGQFDWTFWDRMVETATRRGISIYGILAYWSTWTRPYTPEGIADYCRYARACVERYRGTIRHWEVWNEPNIFFWSGPKELYAELLKSAYAAIKEGNPEAIVCGCSVCGAGGAMDFVRKVMEASAPFDILTIHPYRHQLEDLSFQAELRNIASEVRAGSTKRDIWITEVGWGTQVLHNSHDGGGAGVSEREQACLLARIYLNALASGVCGNISWYDFINDGVVPVEWEHNLGLLRRDGNPKPGFRAFGVMTHLLARRTRVRRINAGPNCVGLSFSARNADEDVLVLWALDQPRTVVLPDRGHRWRINLMGEASPLEVSRGRVSVHVPLLSPVYLCHRGWGRAKA